MLGDLFLVLVFIKPMRFIRTCVRNTYKGHLTDNMAYDYLSLSLIPTSDIEVSIWSRSVYGY